MYGYYYHTHTTRDLFYGNLYTRIARDAYVLYIWYYIIVIRRKYPLTINTVPPAHDSWKGVESLLSTMVHWSNGCNNWLRV